VLPETKKAKIKVITHVQLPFLKIILYSLLTVRNGIPQPYSLIISMQASEYEVNITGIASEETNVKYLFVRYKYVPSCSWPLLR